MWSVQLCQSLQPSCACARVCACAQHTAASGMKLHLDASHLTGKAHVKNRTPFTTPDPWEPARVSRSKLRVCPVTRAPRRPQSADPHSPAARAYSWPALILAGEYMQVTCGYLKIVLKIQYKNILNFLFRRYAEPTQIL